MRIKILKTQGIQWAGDLKLPVYGGEGYLKGITYNLENGEIVKSKLKKSDILRERVTSYFSYLNAPMPNVKVGSVVDLEFSYGGIPSEWRFQNLIPVKYCELDLTGKSDKNRYRFAQYGFENITKVSDNRWKVENMPAFKIEAYTSTYKNYITKYEIEYFNIIHEWSDISQRLYDMNSFGLIIDTDNTFKSPANDIIEKTTEIEDQVKHAFNYVKQIKWDKRERILASYPDFKTPFNNKSGSSSDINLSLLTMLRFMKFEAYPVILSTRENGLLPLTNPNIDKINHVIVYATKNGHNYLLDATEAFMPYDLLPVKDLNWQAQVLVNKDKAIKYDVAAIKTEKQRKFFQLTLDDELAFSGTINAERKDYAAYYFRKDYKEYSSDEEYISDFSKELPGLRITNFNIENVDDYEKPITETYQVNINDNIAELGDKLLFNPLFMEKMDENPFKAETRNYPIDFAHPIEKAVTINITIPEGFTIVETPAPISLMLPNKAAICMYQVSQMGNSISVNYKFSINKALFNSTEYADLKNFFNKIIEAQSKMVVLKRS